MSESSDFDEVIHVRETPDDELILAELPDSHMREAEDQEQVITSGRYNQDTLSDSLLTLKSIDANWLSRLLAEKIASLTQEEIKVMTLEKDILATLGNLGLSARDSEKRLISMLGHQNLEIVKILLKNRFVIYFGTLLSQASTASELQNVKNQMQNCKQGELLL